VCDNLIFPTCNSSSKMLSHLATKKHELVLFLSIFMNRLEGIASVWLVLRGPCKISSINKLIQLTFSLDFGQTSRCMRTNHI
jgi:hypothetical protein